MRTNAQKTVLIENFAYTQQQTSNKRLKKIA